MIGEGSTPDFDYTRLNDIKPALIAEATANARESALQFAKDPARAWAASATPTKAWSRSASATRAARR
jgi:hypothetical protein